MRGDAPQSRRRVAVIGAGAAGLCAAKHLLGQGIDVVIHELGNHIGGLWVDLPFLSAELSPVRERWLELFHHVVHPACPGLYFLGFFNVSGGGNIRMMDDQAEWVAAIESGRVALPEPADMTRAIAADREDKIKRNPDSPRYGLELDPRDYRAGLSREMRQGMKRTARVK